MKLLATLIIFLATANLHAANFRCQPSDYRGNTDGPLPSRTIFLTINSDKIDQVSLRELKEVRLSTLFSGGHGGGGYFEFDEIYLETEAPYSDEYFTYWFGEFRAASLRESGEIKLRFDFEREIHQAILLSGDGRYSEFFMVCRTIR